MKKLKVCLIIWIVLLSCCDKVNSSCNETLECMTDDGTVGICEENRCLTPISSKSRENLEFTITARYPDEKLAAENQKLYIRGDGLGLTWKTGKLMTKTSANSWTVNITYISSTGGYRCQDCSDITTITKKFQYRIFLDDSTNMIGGNFAIDLPVSMASPYFNSKPYFEVFPWFNKRNGTATNFKVASPEIGKIREISLYLPPSFHENNLKKYPKIFVFDLSPMYLQLNKASLDELLGKSGTAKECILIGFGDYQPPDTERSDLLTPTPGSFPTCINGTFRDRCDDCLPLNASTEDIIRILRDKCGKPSPIAAIGDKTLDFFLMTVLPKVQEITNNRLLTDQANTGIMGYSLGGLMSCYAAWTRASDFGMAACQSPSLWWPYNSTTFNDCEFDFLNKTLNDKNLKTRKFPQKILLDAGSIENADPYRLTQSTVEAAIEMSKLPYFHMNENLWLNIYPGSPHSVKEWVMRFWTTLQTLLPSAGDPGIRGDTVIGSVNVENGANGQLGLRTSILVSLLVFILQF